MKYRQKVTYQNINGLHGRDCNERWNIIKPYISDDSLTLDMGSAEGFFSNKIVKSGNNRKVVSVEGSPVMAEAQRRYNKDLISNKSIIFNESIMTPELFLEKYIPTYIKFNNILCLSVIHWFENPDLMLKYLTENCDFFFFEMPDLDDTKSYNQKYLNYVKNEFGTIDNYITTITTLKIIEKHVVKSHMAYNRDLVVLSR